MRLSRVEPSVPSWRTELRDGEAPSWSCCRRCSEVKGRADMTVSCEQKRGRERLARSSTRRQTWREECWTWVLGNCYPAVRKLFISNWQHLLLTARQRTRSLCELVTGRCGHTKMMWSRTKRRWAPAARVHWVTRVFGGAVVYAWLRGKR